MAGDRQQLREKLMSTGYFIDNEYLEKYLELVCEDEADTSRGCERHHILPQSYFRELKQDIDNSPENLVQLRYREHCLAHWYLYQCTRDFLKKNNAYALQFMVGQDKKWNSLTEEELLELLDIRSRVAIPLPEEEEAIRDYLTTHTTHQSAQHYGVWLNTITNWKLRLGIPLKARNSECIINKESFIAYVSCHSQKEAIDFFQLRGATINRLKRIWGLKVRSRGKVKNIDPQEFREYLQTHTGVQACKHFHISPNTVTHLKRRFGIAPNIHRVEDTLDLDDFKQYTQRHSLKETAQKFNIGVHTVTHWRKKLGVTNINYERKTNV